MKRRIACVICLLVFLCSFGCLLTERASAAHTSETYEFIEPDRICSLSLHYGKEDVSFPGMHIRIFRVAEVSDEFIYTLCGDFAEYPVKLAGIKTQEEWDVITSTLNSYILADAIEPTASQITDENGDVYFEELATGMYLVQWAGVEVEDVVTGFEPFMISLPNLNTEKTWDYDVVASPKPGDYTPTGRLVNFKVVKQWKDAGFADKRPDSVEVEIYKNGELFETAVLSSENDWCYRWEAIDDGTEWSVVEREVPKDYTVTVVENGETIVVTNAYVEPPEPPKTGEHMILWPYILLMSVSGIALIILVIAIKRGSKCKDKD